MTNIINILSMIIYLFFVLIFLKGNKYWSLYLFFVISSVWVLVSVLYIEQGIYIFEQDRNSFETGATMRLAIMYLIFFSTSMFFLNLFDRRKKVKKFYFINNFNNNKLVNYLIIYVLFFMSLFIFVDGFLTYKQYNGSYTRFNYYEYSIFSHLLLYRIITHFLHIISLLLGYYLGVFKTKTINIIIVFSLINLLSFSYFQGNKFSGFYLILVLFFIPILIKKNILIQFKKINFKKILIISFFVFGFIAIVFNLSLKEYSQSMDVNDAKKFITYRILGLQGHVWWGSDNLGSKLSKIEKQNNIEDELNIIFLKQTDEIYGGLDKLMITISPKIGMQYIENGVSFTMGFPAILNILFNDLGKYMILVLFSLIFSYFLYYLYQSIINKDLIMVILFAYIFILGVIQYFTMGRTSALFNWRMYLIILLIIYIQFLRLLLVKKKPKFIEKIDHS